jgi:suppressor of G2 allele of SKP1
MDKASRGAAALNEGRLDDAIKEYTAAIIENPLAPDYFIKRSTAYQRASPPQYDAALKDAETAVVLAHRRAKRELIAQAQLRRAIILYCLERYGDSEFILGVVKKLNGSEKTLPIWENKVKQKKNKLPEGDEKAIVTVKELPVIEEKEKDTTIDTVKDEAKDTAKPLSTVSASSKVPEQTPPNKIKHDWYQSSDKVYFTLLAKGVPKEQATVQISTSSVSIFKHQTRTVMTNKLLDQYLFPNSHRLHFRICSRPSIRSHFAYQIHIHYYTYQSRSNPPESDTGPKVVEA